MNEVPAELAGALTVALIVVLGVFVYPPLLRRRGGRWLIVLASLLLTALALLFDRPSGLSRFAALASALAIALAPLITGLVVARLNRKPS